MHFDRITKIDPELLVELLFFVIVKCKLFFNSAYALTLLFYFAKKV